jgi:hypothetical protein
MFVNQPLDLTFLLFFLQLLNSERLSIFAADLQVSFLLFEALRTHLKFQLEFYLTRVIDIIISDSPKITYEQKEIALGNVPCCTLHANITHLFCYNPVSFLFLRKAETNRGRGEEGRIVRNWGCNL